MKVSSLWLWDHHAWQWLVACHNRVMIELYHCQTDGDWGYHIKLIHRIENIKYWLHHNRIPPYFIFSPAVWSPGVRLRVLVVVTTSQHVKHISFLLFGANMHGTPRYCSWAATASGHIWNWTHWIFSVISGIVPVSIKFPILIAKRKVSTSEYEEKTKLGSIKLEN